MYRVLALHSELFGDQGAEDILDTSGHDLFLVVHVKGLKDWNSVQDSSCNSPGLLRRVP